MKRGALRRLCPVSIPNVRLDDRFWAPRLQTNRTVTLPIEYEQLKGTRRIDAWKLDWKPGMPNEPHIFWDSDLAKWLEAVGYALAGGPDKPLERRADRVIAMIERAQQPDGYLNIHFSVVAPRERWTNLRDRHELYCAGHLMEAAVAYCQATGKRTLLDVMCRYADYINSVFGPERGKRRGYPGHEEIELALVKLHRATGEERYLKLAKFFVDERGRRPHYFDREARERGEDPQAHWAGDYDYCQAHLPVREQATAEGHAVRAMYLYSGMADVAAETRDRKLLAACKRLWKNVTERRMYLTGGIGSTRHGERFTCDYDLPNETAYAETCAAIGLVLWAHRMLQIERDGRYADVMERALYNGVLSGISLDGRRFFYVNPLAVYPRALTEPSEHLTATRQDWFGCACCPPNIARLLASLPQYVYSQARNEAYVHLFVQGSAELTVAGQSVVLIQRTGYPWKERVRITVKPDEPAEFTLALRIPGWCRGATLKVNGKAVGAARLTRKGYARIKRVWRKGDKVELRLPMPVERIEAHPKVRANAGRVALQRGPIVYCLEEVDNGPNLNDIALPRTARLRAECDEKLLGGVVVVTGKARRRDASAWRNRLYGPSASRTRSVTIKAVPYCAWANRRPGEMLVWIREA